MYDKKEDHFFDENLKKDQSSEELMNLIDKYDQKIRTDIKPGSKITGTVTRIGSEYVFVDIGGKNEAMIKNSEVKESDGSIVVKTGDQISAYVISNTPGETVLSKSLGGYTGNIQELKDALNNKIPVQGKVTGINKGGLNVKVMGYRAFCPVSQIDIKFTEDVNIYLGKTLDFVISRISEGGRNIVLSRIPLLEEGLESKFEKLSNMIAQKEILTGKITKVTKFGLFIDLGDGIEGLVHISEISWERAEKLEESFETGQEVEFLILKIEKKRPLHNSKISLSIKQVLDDPWSRIKEELSVGQSVQGKVTRLTNFGAFVELYPGVEGLVHISEMSWAKRVHHPSEIVQEGNLVNVTILNIDETKKAVSLSLKDIKNDPWRDVEERFVAGSEIAGTVAKKSRYGYFVDLAEGVTGLLVFSRIVPDKKDSFKEGDEITVIVESVDKENRRISLSYGMRKSEEDKEEVSEFIKKQRKEKPDKRASTEFGAALLAALKKTSD